MKALFLACALALPVPSIHGYDDGGSTIDRDSFFREYDWLKELLEHEWPGNDFMIMPVKWDRTPPGWIWVPFSWRGHLIYRRPLKEAA
jgi:hypothetical protein